MTELKSYEMTEEELRIAIANEILGWKLTQVPPDINGINECVVLTPRGKLLPDFAYPPKGYLSPAYHVPNYGQFIPDALSLCRRVGLRTPACDLPTEPIQIARMCLDYYRLQPCQGKL